MKNGAPEKSFGKMTLRKMTKRKYLGNVETDAALSKRNEEILTNCLNGKNWIQQLVQDSLSDTHGILLRRRWSLLMAPGTILF
jgi:hypothetical protein